MTAKQMREYRGLMAEALLESKSPAPDHERLKELLEEAEEIERFIKGIPKARAHVALGIYYGIFPPFQAAPCSWKDVMSVTNETGSAGALHMYLHRAMKDHNRTLQEGTR